jgi:hypothetical protein
VNSKVGVSNPTLYVALYEMGKVPNYLHLLAQINDFLSCKSPRQNTDRYIRKDKHIQTQVTAYRTNKNRKL